MLKIGAPVENRKSTLTGEITEVNGQMVKVIVELTGDQEVWLSEDVISLIPEDFTEQSLNDDSQFFVNDIRKILGGYMVVIDYVKKVPGTVDIYMQSPATMEQFRKMHKALVTRWSDTRYPFWWEAKDGGAVFHFVLGA